MKDYKIGYGDCPNCENTDVMLIDMIDIDWTYYDELCGSCIRKHGENVYHQLEREKRRQSDLSSRHNTHYENTW